MAGQRGRAAGFKMPEEHRLKIANSNILRALIEHACGEREMLPSQVTAGLGLLKKVMPDLQSVDMTADVTSRHEDWIDRLSRSTGEAPSDDGSAVLRAGVPEDQVEGGDGGAAPV